MKRSSLGQSVSIVAIAILLILTSACDVKKESEVKSVNDTTQILTAGPGGGDSVWKTTQRPSGNTITFVYPGYVPTSLKKIDLSKYYVLFLPVYPDVVDTSGVDTVLTGTKILILNVIRFDTTNVPINNYIGVGVADQPIPLLTTTFSPWWPTSDSTNH